jgi:hypothetical protein
MTCSLSIQGLPAKNRPEEWSKWASKTRHGARNYQKVPNVEDPADLANCCRQMGQVIQRSRILEKRSQWYGIFAHVDGLVGNRGFGPIVMER